MTIHPRRPTTVVGADISGDAQPSVVAVDFEPGHQRALARVCGEVDIEDADELGADLAAALDVSVSGLDVDLSAVTFCDCSCLHMLFRLNRRAERAGKTLVLTALGPRVDRLLRLTETEHLFTVQAARPASAPAEPGPQIETLLFTHRPRHVRIQLPTPDPSPASVSVLARARRLCEGLEIPLTVVGPAAARPPHRPAAA
ncbi:hypothetical protein GCM10010222_12230 [Streptomyces tanashiensis]|uniref:STAS domain-containing protein n=1 Tax=Streptomyces tanashiensis TaxID=67367 RepID=UPI0016733719|nr:STAS domain-containing protein [Streptomyces tanashiensis]GGS72939.1 hypothetical protein GCM10010222_12230 [Streptomyces tanashiensis]